MFQHRQNEKEEMLILLSATIEYIRWFLQQEVIAILYEMISQMFLRIKSNFNHLIKWRKRLKALL